MPAVPVAMKIYDHDLPPTAWRMLWWLLCNMDDDGDIQGRWKHKASEELGIHRVWANDCAVKLRDAGLINYQERSKMVRVLTKNILG